MATPEIDLSAARAGNGRAHETDPALRAMLSAALSDPAASAVVREGLQLLAREMMLDASEAVALEGLIRTTVERDWSGGTGALRALLRCPTRSAFPVAVLARGRAIAGWVEAALRRSVDLTWERTLLDVGAGEGRVAETLAGQFPALRVTCADVEDHLAIPLPFRLVPAESPRGALSAPPRPDVVLINHVLHHLPVSGAGWSQDELLAEAAAASRDRVIVTDTVVRSREEHRGFVLLDWLYTHVVRGWTKMEVPGTFHTLDGWRQVFERAGLEIASLDIHERQIGINPKQDITFVLRHARSASQRTGTEER